MVSLNLPVGSWNSAPGIRASVPASVGLVAWHGKTGGEKKDLETSTLGSGCRVEMWDLG